MNLTELQMELRNIKERISQLHYEIEKMKPKTDEQKKTDYEAITKLAKSQPINNLSIIKASELLKKEFINSLSYMIIAEGNNIYSRLLYLCRLAMGCKLKVSAEDIYKSGLEFETEDIEKTCVDLQEYKYTYLIEALILANLAEDTPVNMLGIIADMASLMGCDKEEIRVLAQVAKSKLTDNIDIIKDIPLPLKNWWSGKLGDYISNEWICSQRKECISICIDMYYRERIGSLFLGLEVKNYHPCVVNSRKQAGEIVKKGETILVYEDEEEGTRTINAPCNGVVYFVESDKKGKIQEQDDKYLDVYVVSYFDDYDDFCKWHKNKSNK